ncbi:hypothetical protein [Acetobacter sacchari]|uniref:hypothetical protein n=1 Tax=Acetobacter sacchari TaxID=2661687 RepID=UPI0038CF47EA
MAFVLDVFARCIVGWHVSRTRRERALDTLEQATHTHYLFGAVNLAHHSDCGSRYVPYDMPSVWPRSGSPLARKRQ